MAELKKYLDTTALGTLVEQIKAEDVKVKAYADAQIEAAGKLYDAAGAATTAEANAKGYTDALANGQVATNKADIAKLNGDANTDGSVAKAVAGAKAELEASIAATDAKAVKNAQDIAAINNEETGVLAQAKTFASAEDAKVQKNIDELAGTVADLDTYIGDIPTGYTETNVIAYINKKAEETLNAASGGSSESAASVLQALNTYKAENDPKVNKNIEDIAGLVADLAEETGRATAAEEANAAAIKVISDDYLKTADKTELQGNINTVSAAVERLTNGVSADEVDGVNDLIQYVKDHGTEVTGMQGDIADNTEAIAGVAGRMDTAEGKITAVEGAVATKAEKSYVDEQVGALQGVDTGLGNRITALENKFGGADGSVEDMIADAKQEAVDAAATAADTKDEAVLAAAKKYADDEDAKIEARVDALETASGTHALASDLNTLAGRVTTAEGEIDTLQSEMDAVEAKAAANESAIGTLTTTVGTKAAQADLEAAVARIAANEGSIETLNGTVADKAEQDDLDAAVERIAKNEGDIAALTSSVNSFSAITSDEVRALFA